MGQQSRRSRCWIVVCSLWFGAAVAVVAIGCSSSSSSPRGDAAAPDATAPSDASASPDAAPTGALDCSPTCNDKPGGTCGPLLVCSAANPCADLNSKQITTEITLPTCITSKANHPTFNDSPPKQWTNALGQTRAACEYIPPSAGTQVPLVVFLHGSHGSADDVYNDTLLRQDAVSASLKPGITGFALASMQGRNLHWLGSNPGGSHHDWMFRDLASPSKNPDIADLDHLVDTLVKTGKIDPKRIYVMGWSNGAFFGQMYAIARYTTATPGGNHVASAVMYAGADPFGDPIGTNPSCQLASDPTSSVPIDIVHRSCDAIVPCDAAQATKFGVVPDYAVEPWFQKLTGSVGDANAHDTIVNAKATLVSTCAAVSLCTKTIGTLNHLHWPDGIDDSSGHNLEPAMLAFLRNHPHP